MALNGPWGTFIHIPKTGGISLRYALRTIYQTAGEEAGFTHSVPPTYDKAFAVVRHPVAWLRSYYTYRVKFGWMPKWDAPPCWNAIMGMTYFADRLPWDEWVKAICTQKPGLVGLVYALYDVPRVTFYRLENITELFNDLGIKVFLPQLNVGENKPDVTDEQRLMMCEAEKATLERYGYEAGDI